MFARLYGPLPAELPDGRATRAVPNEDAPAALVGPVPSMARATLWFWAAPSLRGEGGGNDDFDEEPWRGKPGLHRCARWEVALVDPRLPDGVHVIEAAESGQIHRGREELRLVRPSGREQVVNSLQHLLGLASHSGRWIGGRLTRHVASVAMDDGSTEPRGGLDAPDAHS